MADCYKFQQHINDLIDENIDAVRKKELEDHLKVCSSCNENLEYSKLINRSLKSLPRYKTSSSFDIVLRSRLLKEINKSHSFINLPFLPSLRPVPAFAAFTIILIFVGVLIGNSLNILNKNSTQKLIAVERAGYTEDEQTGEANPPDPANVRLKMNNYVNVFEQFPVSANNPRDLSGIEYNGGRIEKVQNDSMLMLRNNASSRPLIRQANASVHF